MRILLFLLISSISFSAQAQEELSVRVSEKEGYSRLVLEAKSKLAHDVTQNEKGLSIGFKKAVSVSSQSFDARNIGAINQGNEQLIIVQIPEGAKFRNFTIGKKIIVDVYNSDGKPSRQVTVTATPPPSSKKKKNIPPPPSQEAMAEDKVSKNVMPKEEVAAVEKQVLSGEKPHVITLTTTQNVGMAAFVRAGFLWLVFDRADLTSPPLIAGPNKDALGPLEKMDVTSDNASVFRLKASPLSYYYGEGGGLLWRIVATPNPRNTQPIKPIIEDIERNIVWPFKNSRKVITMKDPLIGDEIKVVTVMDSEQFSGVKRGFVEFDVLPSIVGLAFIPKAENIDAVLSSKGATISRPQGLAISPSRDTVSVTLKGDIQKETELFEAEEKTGRLTTIYDFERWQMGGARALEKNRQILMRGVGSKRGSAKVEDLLTLAKLNIANDRGQEALGLLRVAQQELPGIESNNEYIALHGAAAALAGKFDEAAEQFFNEKLNSYGEIRYWKSFILAGLEDWRQADRVVPEDLTILERYPHQIKEPLALMLSEVALRAGKPEKAQELLGLLEDEFTQMNIQRQSAWKYLNGELERQNNKPDQALENWQPLLEGTDDYYRAKAGLSVTRMQLERQKITPEKAIDRLEGLRYAWRGDELETLINYRLGEVYIDNENYLKGLSTLRNAVSLSPDAKITEEVTDYMTNTFRSLFTQGKLSDVSALDAVSIYDEFKELTPIGKEGDSFVQELAERLVDVDLLGRAASLLDHQINHRLDGVDKENTAIRLAAIYLLDKKSAEALVVLNNIQTSSLDAQGRREVDLLKARGLSKTGESGKALGLLRAYKNDLDVVKLRADISWNASRWRDAAAAFNDLIGAENISLTRPMTDYQERLVLNRAIALNLSGDRATLSSHRNRFNDLMLQSSKRQIFDMVTRPRQIALGNDQESVSSLISEVDLFGDFLENYKKFN